MLFIHDLQDSQRPPIQSLGLPGSPDCDLHPTSYLYSQSEVFTDMFPKYVEYADQWYLSNQVIPVIDLMEGEIKIPLTSEQHTHLTRAFMNLALQFTHEDPSHNDKNTYELYLAKLEIFKNPENYAMFRDAFLTSLDSAKNTLPSVNNSLIKDGLGDSCFKTVADYYLRGVDPKTKRPIGTTSMARDLFNRIAFGQIVDPELLKDLGDGFFFNYRDRYDSNTGSVSGILAALNESWGVPYNSRRAQKSFSKSLESYKDGQRYMLDDISNIKVQDRDVVLSRLDQLKEEKRIKDAWNRSRLG